MQLSNLFILLSATFLFSCSLKPKQVTPLTLGKYTDNFYGGGYQMIEFQDGNTFHYQVRVGMNWIDAEGNYQQDGNKLYLTTFDQKDDTKYTIFGRSKSNQSDSLTLVIQGYELPLPYALVRLSPTDSLISDFEGFVTLPKNSIQESIIIEFITLWDALIPKDSIQTDTVHVKLFEKPHSVYWNEERFKIKGNTIVHRGEYKRRYVYEN